MPNVEDTARDISRDERVNRLWFILTAALILLALAVLPFAVKDLRDEVRYQASSTVYDVFTGQEIAFGASVPADAAFVNVAATDIDEARRLATLMVSGNRVCEAACPPITVGLFAIGQDADRRLGLPPSATFALPNDSGPYTETVTLPVTGWPQRYPFDTYALTLGLTAETTLPDDTRVMLDAPQIQANSIIVTLEDRLARLSMSPPTAIDPASVASPGASATFFAVNSLLWQRPLFLRMTTILLVLLIAASAVFALSLKDLDDLLLGIGGIILGVWGVRSIVVQTPLPVVTWVDVALALVILILLLALSIRAALHFYRLSGWRWGK